MSDYEMLKAYGHSPAKVSEILLDAKRGDAYAKGWIAVALIDGEEHKHFPPRENPHALR